MTQRVSGEVVNATQLEIFLALVFLVLAVAWSEQVKADSTIQQNDSLRARAESLEKERRGLPSGTSPAQLIREVDRLKQENNVLQFQSRFPPFCTSDARPLFEATLLPKAEITMTALRYELGVKEGTRIDMRAAAPPPLFERVRAYSRAHGCRFRVVIHDRNTTKEEYKAAMATLVATFYTIGAYSP